MHWCSATESATDGSAAVHFAAIRGHLEVLKWLCTGEGGANGNDVDDNGTTPLYYSAQGAAHVGTTQPGGVPILAPFVEGHLHCVRWLVEVALSNPLQPAHDGMTAIHAAAQAGRRDCTGYLLSVVRKKYGWGRRVAGCLRRATR